MSAIGGVRGDAGVVGAVLVVALVLIAPGCAPKPADDATTSDAAVTEEAMTEEELSGAETVAATPETARRAGQLAAAIEAEPARLAELLAEQGWTADAFEALLVEIAADPGLTDAYEAARTGS